MSVHRREARIAFCLRRLRYAVQLAQLVADSDPREAVLYLRMAVEDVTPFVRPRRSRRQ